MLRAASGCGGLLHCSGRAAGAAAGGAVAMAAPGSKDSSGRRLGMLETAPYRPPSWAEGLHPLPSHWTGLGHLPTPVHRWDLPSLPEGTQVWIKRDDLTGLQLSGNKVRKLEFLLADAKLQGADCVITIGGIQSNHCRATAVAARYLGLDSFLILRTSQALLEQDPGLQGNLLVERLVGANLELVSKEEYQAHGSVALGERLAARLRAEGRKPYLVPVGGSNSLGSWGYLEAVRELELQLEHGDVPGASSFHDVVMACGSGGTTAGAAVGCRLGSLQAKVHAYAVCDSPDYFYDYVQGLISGLGSELKARDVVRVVDAKGLGYAVSTREELGAVKAVAEATGVILDPVYSGKALIALLRDMEREPEAWKGRNVLFWHTGGLLGLYDKVAQLQPLVGRCQRFLGKVEEKEKEEASQV